MVYFKKIYNKILRKPSIVPYDIQLELTNICNMSCRMCSRHYLNIDARHIEIDTLKLIVDRLDKAEEIALNGLGEPFTHPHIFEAIKYCKLKGLKVKITTNGLLLNSDDIIEQVIASGLDSLSFSIDTIHPTKHPDAHNNIETLNNIKRILHAKETKKSSTPQITIQSVLFKDPLDVYDIIYWGAKHNVDRFNILRVDHYFDESLLRPNIQEEKEIFKQFKLLRNKYRIPINCVQDQIFLGLQGFLYKKFKFLLGLDTLCHRLLYYTYITMDGNVNPCWLLSNQIFGNILEQDIKTIWNGKGYKKFRSSHDQLEKMCTRCDYMRLKQMIS